MNARHRELLSYASATAAMAIAGVVMTPLLARVLSREAFGQWALLEPTILVATQIGLAGTNYGAVKLVGHDGMSAHQAYWSLARTALITSLASAAVAALLVGWWGSGAALAAWLALSICADAQYTLSLASLRGQNRATSYAVGVMGKAATIVTGAAAAAFLGWPELRRPEDIVGLYAIASTTGLFISVLALGTRNQLPSAPAAQHPPATDRPVHSAIRYGVPLLCAGLMANVITIADRYILGGHLGAAEVAIYAITVKLANLLNLLATPVNLWFPAARFLHARDADRGQAFFSTLACRATWAYTGTGALMWLAAPLILPWFAPGYEWNPLAGALLVTAAVCLAVAPPLNIGLLTEGKTRWNFAISSATALLQVILLLVLIPVLGLTGAALATCCSQAASTVLQHLGSQRSHRMQWQYRRMAVIVATAAGSTGALYLWQAHAPRHNAAIFFATWLLMGWLTLKQPAQPT